MSHDLPNLLFNLPPALVDPVASQVLGTKAVAVGELSTKKIGRSVGQATAGVYRVVGQAKTLAGERAWSAVAKVLGPPEHPQTEVKPQIETDVYRSGVFAELCGGVRAARYYAIQEWQGLQLLWLEDLSAAPQPPWLVQYFVPVASHLGQFNAHWPEPALPQWTWLNREGFGPQFKTPGYEEAFERLPTRLSEPLIRLVAPPEMVDRLLNLWAQSDALFTQVEATAKGICHRDCHPNNLFPMGQATEQGFTIAIDWENVGIDCLGHDIGTLLCSPTSRLEHTLDQAKLLVEPIFDAYMTGLFEAGWAGNEDQVRLTYLTRLGCEAFRIIYVTSQATENPRVLALLETFLMKPFEAICTHWAQAQGFHLAYAEEALRLANRLRTRSFPAGAKFSSG
jgi:hypothetical protein